MQLFYKTFNELSVFQSCPVSLDVILRGSTDSVNNSTWQVEVSFFIDVNLSLHLYTLSNSFPGKTCWKCFRSRLLPCIGLFFELLIVRALTVPWDEP